MSCSPVPKREGEGERMASLARSLRQLQKADRPTNQSVSCAPPEDTADAGKAERGREGGASMDGAAAPFSFALKGPENLVREIRTTRTTAAD